jgi:pentose-5-phosphate-3-epimerase
VCLPGSRCKYDGVGLVCLLKCSGGINEKTAARVAGADVLVAGSYLFEHPQSLSQGLLDVTAAATASNGGGPK